jgi:hypothetical protein
MIRVLDNSFGVQVLNLLKQLTITSCVSLSALAWADQSENGSETARIVRHQLQTEADLAKLLVKVGSAHIVTSETCWDLPWQDKGAALPGQTNFDCGAGGYIRSIHFTHPHGQNATFQESVAAKCCKLNIGIQYK